MRDALLASTAIVALSAFGTAAWAQTAAPLDQGSAPATTTVGEVVVTAQKRSERLQDVPITVSAFNANALAQSHVTDVQDLSGLVPGFQGPGDNGDEPIHLRGIGALTFGAGNDSSVPLYVDGVYIANPSPSLFSLADASQVEVLKGPQGTLFGRNSTGGLIQVTTQTPGQTPQANGQVSYGNYDTVSGNLYAGGPIADAVSADISAQALHQGEGYGRNLFNGASIDRTDLDMMLRSKWVFHLPDSTDLQLIADYERNRGVGESGFRIVPGTLNALTPLPTTNNPWDIDSNDVEADNFSSGGISAKLTHDLGFAQLTSITAYRRQVRTQGPIDYDVTAVPAIGVDSGSSSHQVSEELELGSPSSGRLQWTTGLYYFGSGDRAFSDFMYGGPFTALIPYAANTSYGSESTESISGFGQASYEVIDRTKVTFGFRFTSETRNETGYDTLLLHTGMVVPGTGAQGPTSGRVSYDVPTWRVSVDHKFSDTILGYVTASRGFKSGGFNLDDPQNPPFNPEYLNDYEGGFKTTLFNRRLRFNVATFFYDYNNIQVTEFTEAGTQFYNGAGAHLYGGDVDFEFRATPQFTLSGALEALHSEFTSFPNAVISIANPTGGYTQLRGSAKGNELPNAPAFTSSLTADYKLPTQFGDFDLTTTWSHSDGYFTEVDNHLHQPTYDLVGASLLFSPTGQRYTVRLWAQNLTNAAVENFEQTSTISTGLLLNAPRTYGFTVGFKY